MADVVHDPNVKKCLCDACAELRRARTAAARAAAVGAAHKPDCRCRPCTKARRDAAQAALQGAQQPQDKGPVAQAPEDKDQPLEAQPGPAELVDVAREGQAVEDARDVDETQLLNLTGSKAPLPTNQIPVDQVVERVVRPVVDAGQGEELPPRCTTCDRFKVPVGYDELTAFCGSSSCAGYAAEPLPEREWPLERRAREQDVRLRREHAALVVERQRIR